ncbi:hypothetical protein [[Mycobacterium] holstebronense]|uniref:Uncharacterized protein n=1 Tax=[Mycobacterium] holstebronense TaxID=3064288 RepID=A0ABN9N032_9MYCO|nr:hypothetical protein [Mycolicibacter sp. MU0102]CAJ1496273.1 hypothetical protein MU0102_000177 [Mycolicibacter sp. MU0102]
MTQGHQLFADELTALAMQNADPRLAMIAAAITAPLQVAVRGRRGVGRRTVAAALAAAGVRVAEQPAGAQVADLSVHVVAEVIKPEDTAALHAARRHPVLVVLNKADLCGHDGVAEVAGATRGPVEPMSALFALAALGGGLDEALWEALGRVAARPADLRCAELFVSGPHPVPRQTRERLCATVDLSGVAALLDLAGSDGTVAQARARMRRLSGVDRVVAQLKMMGAAVHHRRMSEAVIRLEAMAVGDSRLDEFLNRDATAAARLSAAATAVDVPEEPVLARARRWQAHRSAPVNAAQRSCAADIARGSLRAWAATRDRP